MKVLEQALPALLHFEFYYPLIMAYVWVVGAVLYFVRWEFRVTRGITHRPIMGEYPPVSFVVPCHNEAANIESTLRAIAAQEYPTFEIIAVDDGSSDDTARLLKSLQQTYGNLRVITLESNQGKAMALRMGAMVSRYEFLICIDGDAILDSRAALWIMTHFVYEARVGAVTGNPRVRNRSSLLGRIQVGEFSSIVGMIKRAQRIYGRVFTVSGVIAGFRKAALQDVGYWSLDMVTEDIDISWKLQINHWDVRFEPLAFCWILMPESFKGLWRQRLRWSQGGVEVLLKYFRTILRWRKRRMWLVYAEYCASVCWAYGMATVLALWFLGAWFPLPESLRIEGSLFGWNGMLLGLTCLVQFAVSLAIDSRYEQGVGRFYYWMIWYPMAYWLLNVLTTVVALPKALAKAPGRRAIWESPDRGLEQ